MEKTVVTKPTVTFDDGFYAEARNNAMWSPNYLATLDPAPPEAVDKAVERFLGGRVRSHDRTTLDMDAVRMWAEGRAALANQLSWYEQTTGKRIVTVQDFYSTDIGITSLFPAWIESEIQATLLATGLVPFLTMGTEAVDSTKVTGLYDSTPARERSLALLSEGAELPVVKLTLADSIIYLYKYGRAVQTSYEALAKQRIDALRHHFARMVQQVAADETDTALSILVAGDGTTMGAAESNATDTDVAVAGTITFSDLLSWCYAVPEPYELDKAVCGATDMVQIQNLAEFKDAAYVGGPANMPLTGPRALQFRRWTGSVTGSSYLNRMVIGIDSRYALRKYTYGGMVQETDNIIRRQIKEFTFSYYAGFRKFDLNAVEVLDCNTVL